MKRKINFIILIFCFILTLSACSTHVCHQKGEFTFTADGHFIACGCGKTTKENHKFSSTVLKEATCDVNGKTRAICDICGYEETKDTPKIAHDEVVVEAVAPDCITLGKTAGKICGDCGKVLAISEEVGTKPHSFDGDTCSVCGTYNTRSGSYTYDKTEEFGAIFKFVRDIAEKELVVPHYTWDGVEVLTIDGNNPTSTTEKLTLQNGIKYLLDDAFKNSHLLKELVLPDSVTYIGNRAFQNCYSLESVKLPTNLETIGNQAFASCYSLETVEFPNGRFSIENRAFENCISLKEITIPKNTVSIGNEAFKGCTSLGRVIIEDGILAIGENAFADCPSLEYVSIPRSLTLYFDEGDPYWYPSVKQTVGTIGYVETLHFQEGVETIPKLLIEALRPQRIILPSTLKHIDDELFEKIHIKEIIIAEGTKTIGDWAFGYYCDAKSLVIPDSVTYIGNGAFRGMRELESVKLSSSLTEIPNAAFSWTKLKNIDLPSGIVKIGNYSFESTMLQKVELPSELSQINSSAFENCEELTEVKFNKKLRFIGANAFCNTKLKKVELNEGVENILSGAFAACVDLNYVSLPKSLVYLSSDAFSDCKALDVINYAGTVEEWQKLGVNKEVLEKTVDKIVCSDGNIEI